ncbi:nuclear transcription factor Y subunit B-11-like [Lolium rigidum]|uniref:nuclear transcription factor Y subunit B-11-like n=1 Tax=Lolium rigidum TaxID=89674 RepID=UPI001F5C1789|nr:nuclear transcription factor Y subunit B-11-like [Lolium rigidum]
MKNRKSYGQQQSHLLSPVGSPPSDNESGLAATPGGGSGYGGGGGDSPAKEQDRFLPIANVSRIMKRSLPANAKISKEAKETVQECVSEFISFVTGEASDKCQREKRKTINGDDLLWAMTTLGFEAYVAPLKAYLNRYREVEGEKAAVVGGTGLHHGDEDAHSSLSAVAMHGSGDRGGASGVGQDCDVGLMMGVNVGFSAGTGTTFYAAAHERRAYGGGEGAFGGDQEANGAGGERGFAGHLHGVQW